VSAVAAMAASISLPSPRQEQPPVAAVGRVRKARVRVPWRLVACADYPDVALSVYIKVAGLGLRAEGCQAKAPTLARYLGLSTASVERGLTALSRPTGGVVELETERRTYPGGEGASAIRRVRQQTKAESFIWIPVAAAEDLTPRQLRAFVVISFVQQMRGSLTMAELAGYLRHHSGQKAGQPLTLAAVGAVVDEVEAARWISVDRRAGARGRHLFLAHSTAPELRPVDLPEPTPEEAPETGVTAVDNEGEESAGPCVGEGSGGVFGDGSLANRESPRTDSPDDDGAAWSPAVGEVQVRKGAHAVENPAGDAAATVPVAAGGRGLALRAGDKASPQLSTNGTGAPGARTGTKSGDHDGPGLQVPAWVYAVLEPVHQLYPQTTVFVQRRIAREVAHQVNTGTDPERLRQRLERRYARVMSEDIRDAGRWLLGVALPRWGCGHLDCESGVMWSSGKECAVCAEAVADRAVQREAERRRREGLCPQHGTRPGPAGSCVDCELEDAIRNPPPPVAPPVRPVGIPAGNCGGCGARILLVDQAVEDRLCRECRELAEDPGKGPAAVPELVLCAGAPGDPCSREALPTREVCLRHRAQQLAAEAAAGGGTTA